MPSLGDFLIHVSGNTEKWIIDHRICRLFTHPFLGLPLSGGRDRMAGKNLIMKNFVVVLRGGTAFTNKNYGTVLMAMSAAKAESLRYPEARVYCGSTDRILRLSQFMLVKDGHIVSINVRYCGKVVKRDNTIPENLWDEFNLKRK